MLRIIVSVLREALPVTLLSVPAKYARMMRQRKPLKDEANRKNSYRWTTPEKDAIVGRITVERTTASVTMMAGSVTLSCVAARIVIMRRTLEIPQSSRAIRQNLSEKDKIKCLNE